MNKKGLYTSGILHVALVFSMFLISSNVHSQVKYGLSIEGQYVIGTNPGTLYLQDNVIHSGEFHGGEWNVVQNFTIGESPFIPSVKVGFRHFSSEGTMNDTPYKVQSSRVHIDLGVLYKVLPRWSVGFYYGIENNMDLEDFISQTPDLFRHSFSTSLIYHFNQRWSAQLGYQRAISPITTHYLLTNPRNLFKAGIAFEIL